MTKQTEKSIQTEAVEVETTTKPNAQKKKAFKDSDYILCHSVVAGGLNINCRSSNHYEFTEYGGECEIEYRDLVDLIHKRSEHIFLPRIIIDDEDFIENFPQLKKFYNEMYTVGDLKEIVSLPSNQMKQVIATLPSELKTTLKSLVATMIDTGELDSIGKVRALTETLGADFNLLSDLFGKY